MHSIICKGHVYRTFFNLIFSVVKESGNNYSIPKQEADHHLSREHGNKFHVTLRKCDRLNATEPMIVIDYIALPSSSIICSMRILMRLHCSHAYAASPYPAACIGLTSLSNNLFSRSLSSAAESLRNEAFSPLDHAWFLDLYTGLLHMLCCFLPSQGKQLILY